MHAQCTPGSRGLRTVHNPPKGVLWHKCTVHWEPLAARFHVKHPPIDATFEVVRTLTSPHPGGRPSSYSDDLAQEILDRMAEGESLRGICRDEGMPARSTVIRWMMADQSFAARCARAREEQADLMDDLILETANNCGPRTAKSDRVKISAYQWRAAKLKPKRYGDRVEITGSMAHTVAVAAPVTLEESQAAYSEMCQLPAPSTETVN